MHKSIFANRSGLAISFVLLSLFPSTSAWAQKSTTSTAAAQGPQQVIVANTPAQPVPMVGLTSNSDDPARHPFQTFSTQWNTGDGNVAIVQVPAGQRLLVEYASGQCFGQGASVLLSAVDSGYNLKENFISQVKLRRRAYRFRCISGLAPDRFWFARLAA